MLSRQLLVPYVLLFFCLAGVIYHHLSTPKIVSVRSQYVFENYIGMKEAQKVFEQKKSSWQSNLDTLRDDYQKAVSNFNLQQEELSQSEKQNRVSILQRQEQNVLKYAKQLEEQAAKEDQELTQGVINQIDDFIQLYAEEKGYDLIIGNTSSGNVLYGNDKVDITEELLQELNSSYK